MKGIRSHIKFLLLSVFIVSLAVSSCSTKKNTWLRRFYHKTTCHYNVFWNGKNSLYDGAEALTQKVNDNYKEVLRVYNYGTMQEAQTLNAQMDRSIEKASIGIQKHSMYFNGNEYNKWVKISYLMMGEAHFYKQDYTSARRVFDFISKQYSDDPIQYEGYLWLAKTYIETERFEKADAVINYLQSKKDESNFPQKVAREMPFVIADFYLAQKKYNDAYPYLERCLEVGNKRDIITRVYFILGQINELDNDLEKASYYFNKVIKRNADYRMAFEAKMNLARSYDKTTGDSKAIVKILQKMAKEYKNRDFLDQIYFALGEIAMKDGNKEQAMDYYAKSVMFSSSNNYQRSESALTLADIYFDDNNYELAEAYYDTAVSVLPKDFPDYDKIKNKASVLSDLVQLSSTIKVQDSLLNLATLDTTKLYAIIDQVIEQKIKEREEQEALAENGGGVQFADVGQRNRNPNTQTGKWYFYNTAALSYGYSEFIKKWGNRKLEDNWRLSDKRLVMQSYGNDQAEGENPADSVQIEEVNNPEKRAFYLKDIPFEEEQKQAANDLIMKSYKQLGFLYLEDLRDTANALNTYLDLQKNYPDNPYRLEAWYALYKIYNDQGNAEQAAYYKSKILSNYPDSDYAKVISDPDYYIKLAEGNNNALELYEKTYKAFNRGQYFRVITYANKGIDAYPDDTALVPRFMYLRAISLGKVDVPDTLYASLKELVDTYPSSPVVPMAKDVINALNTEYGVGEPIANNTNPADSTKPGVPTIYKFDENAMHLVLVIVNSDNVQVDPLKVRLSDFKKRSFRLLNVRIKSLMLDNKTTLITIGNFGNKREAEKFYTALKADEYVTSGLNPDDFDIVTISINNYPIFYKEKDVAGYLRFFKKYYENNQ